MSRDDVDKILVIVDGDAKYALFIPCKKTMTAHYTKRQALYIHEADVYRDMHGPVERTARARHGVHGDMLRNTWSPPRLLMKREMRMHVKRQFGRSHEAGSRGPTSPRG